MYVYIVIIVFGFQSVIKQPACLEVHREKGLIPGK